MGPLITGTDLVAVGTLKPYPNNPRRGNVEAIIDSLVNHGQYRPIVANARDGMILAGHHVWIAAKQLGWKQIAVTWVDVDDETAKRILLADNRLSDIASYDERALIDMLAGLSDLVGTGFEPEDLDSLIENADGDKGLEDLLPPPPPEEPTEFWYRIGTYRWTVDPDPYSVWSDQLKDEWEGDRRKIITALRNRLGLPQPKKARTKDSENAAKRDPAVEVELVPVARLALMEGNPREGDIGAISESLRLNGQYRPIVARRDGTVLVGNHTVQAAYALGWKEIAVVWADVDDEEAAKIVLVDNRTADLATYDGTELGQLLTSLHGWDGTGFDPDDVEAILAGGDPKPPTTRTSRKKVTLGEYTFLTDDGTWAIFEAGLPASDVEHELMQRIGLSPEWCTVEGKVA